MTIGERVKIVRMFNKLNQTDFANHLKISQTHVSRIEKDLENPSETLLLLISYMFAINFEWLKFETNKMKDNDNKAIPNKSVNISLKTCKGNKYSVCVYIRLSHEEAPDILVPCANDFPPVPFKTACHIAFELESAYQKDNSYSEAYVVELAAHYINDESFELKDRVYNEYEKWRKSNEMHKKRT